MSSSLSLFLSLSLSVSLRWYGEEIKNAYSIENLDENLRNFISHAFSKLDDNLVTNKDPNNQLEFDTCIKEHVRVVLIVEKLQNYTKIKQKD